MKKRNLLLTIGSTALLIGLVGCSKEDAAQKVPTPIIKSAPQESKTSATDDTSKVIYQTKPYEIVTTSSDEDVAHLKEFSRAIVTELNKMYYKAGYQYGELAKEKLSSFTSNEDAVNRYMDFVESYFPSDSIRLKDISMNLTSEIVAKDSNYYYYQATAEATLDDGENITTSNVTYYLKVSEDSDGNFVIEDIRANLGHLLDGGGQTLTPLGEINMVKNKLRTIVNYSIYNQVNDVDSQNKLLEAFRDLNTITSFEQSNPMQVNSKKKVKKVIYNDKEINFEYTPTSDESKMSYKANGTFGVVYQEGGVTKYQAYKFDGLMSSVNPAGDEFSYVFDKLTLSPTNDFDWVQYEKDFIDAE